MDFTSTLFFVLVIIIQNAVGYRPTIITGFTIPTCNKDNFVYKLALYAFTNGVRSHIANGTGGVIINLTSTYITQPRHMQGQTYDCYFEEIARGLLSLSANAEHQGTGYTVNYFAKTHGRNMKVEDLLIEAYNYWLEDTEASLQRLIYPRASYMGCAMKDVAEEGKSDSYNFKVVCAFEDHRPKGSPFLAEPSGRPCRSNSDCSSDRTCRYGLCFLPTRTIVYQ